MKSHVLTLTGSQPGPASMIIAGVHGNEQCGVLAINRLIHELDVQSGIVHIAFGNPQAIELDVRFVESNLNRLFHSSAVLPETSATYEYRRSRFLLKFMDQSSALLDIHASSNPKSKTFAICEENAFAIAKYLPVELVVSGFDAIEPGGSDGYMYRNGRIGICVECGYSLDQRAVVCARANILTFLRVRGHIAGDAHWYVPQQRARVDQLYITASSFSLAREFQDFDSIKARDLIGHDGNMEVRADSDGFILFAHNRKKPNEEAFIMGQYLP